ncbi:MAG: hypothetical protein NTY30_00050 [Candidatus Berkelbacteria bacterium]|nr:hypothetical protein [Candidatus Berkelbacteria bacterium]
MHFKTEFSANVKTQRKMVFRLKELTGQHLALPAGHADWREKLEWFNWDEFARAKVAGFKPAIEWKGKPPSSKIVEEINFRDIYWGIHARNNLTDIAYNDWDSYVEMMKEIAGLEPAYIVVHGGLDTLIDVSAIPLDDPIERYRSPIGAEEYLLACQFQHKLLRDMASRAPKSQIRVENTGVTEFIGGNKLPTYTHPRVGNWLEVAKLARIAKVGVLIDWEHAAISDNFFGRLEDYSQLPRANEFKPASNAERFLWQQLGLGIRKGEFPAARYYATMAEVVVRMKGSHNHLSAGYREEDHGVIATHPPIEIGPTFASQRIRSIINQLLQQENCLMCLEVDGSRADGSGPFPDRQPTEVLQAESWRNLCTIATELTQ